MTTVRATDPCRCDHDFTDHTRRVGHSPYVLANHSDMACENCKCNDYIPVPWSDPFDRRFLRVIK